MTTPPPLRSTGLVLHPDGHFTHEGQPLRHARLRAVLERSVRHLPDEDVFFVQVGRFRGQIDVEDAPYFVRAFDAATGHVELSDMSAEPLREDTLEEDPAGVLYCQVKGECLARFTHAAQAHLLAAVSIDDGSAFIAVCGRRVPIEPRSRSRATRGAHMRGPVP